MPYYDYVCNNCEDRFEFLQKVGEGHKKKCPTCGKHSLSRMISPPRGIHFKGSGFYSTDYKER